MCIRGPPPVTVQLHARDIMSAFEASGSTGAFFDTIQSLHIDLNDGANRRHESYYSAPIANTIQRCRHLRYLELFGPHGMGDIVESLRQLRQSSLAPSYSVQNLALRWSQIRLVADTKLCEHIRTVFPNLDTVDLAACGGGGNLENEWELWLAEGSSGPEQLERRGRMKRYWLSLRPLGNPPLVDVLPINLAVAHLESLDLRFDVNTIRRPQQPLLQGLQLGVAHTLQRLRLDFVGLPMDDSLRPADAGAQILLDDISRFVSACSRLRLLILGAGARLWFGSAQRAMAQGGLLLRELQLESRRSSVVHWMRTLKRNLGGPGSDQPLATLRSITMRIWVRTTRTITAEQLSHIEGEVYNQLQPWCKPRRIQVLIEVDRSQSL